MQINITTFAARKRHYIHETLHSLFESDWRGAHIPVNLIVGSEDESHVREYAAHPSIQIVPWDVPTWPTLRSNCTLNKIRALQFGDDDETLICEDDVLFLPNWLSSLTLARTELGNEEYVLSLFAAQPLLENAGFLPGKNCVKRYPTKVLQGAQALFYPSKAMREKVAEFLKVYLRRAAGDELIGMYARKYAALYATREALVTHIGAISCFPR
jgi:hypothetical protein